MRLILIYDLPMVENIDHVIYTKFHNNLKKLGLYMLQYSVYTKVVNNDTNFNQLIKKLDYIIPKKGSIIVFKITEKQFQDMHYLRGNKNKFESIVGGNELVIFRRCEDE
jgi:CRISPR-associated protein Cas2